MDVMDWEPMYPLRRRSALNRGHWKLHDEFQDQFSDQDTTYEEENDETDENLKKEQERKRKLVQSLFGNMKQANEIEQQNNWKVLSTVSRATSWLATMTRNVIHPGNYQFFRYAGSSPDDNMESESTLFRKSTLEDEKHSHGRINSRSLYYRGNLKLLCWQKIIIIFVLTPLLRSLQIVEKLIRAVGSFVPDVPQIFKLFLMDN